MLSAYDKNIEDVLFNDNFYERYCIIVVKDIFEGAKFETKHRKDQN
jgi:hypothetical protein